MNGRRTFDEWRRASELANAELESFNRREAVRTQSVGHAMAHRAGFLMPDEIERRREYARLVNAAEDARLGLLRVTTGADQPSPSGAEWIATVNAYRRWQARPGNIDRRPTQAEVAAERQIGERTLVGKLRAVGIVRWHDVHALVEAALTD